MSTIKADTLSTLDGTKSITTDRVTQGVARAWVNFNGTGTVAIRASFNVSSITDNGTGNYRVNFTTAMEDVNYAMAGISTWNTSGASGSLLATSTGSFFTTSVNVNVYQTNSLFNSVDSHTTTVVIFR